jgi:hypothetical protein
VWAETILPEEFQNVMAQIGYRPASPTRPPASAQRTRARWGQSGGIPLSPVIPVAFCLCASASRYPVTAGEIHDFVRWKYAEVANSEHPEALPYEVLSG